MLTKRQRIINNTALQFTRADRGGPAFPKSAFANMTKLGMLVPEEFAGAGELIQRHPPSSLTGRTQCEGV